MRSAPPASRWKPHAIPGTEILLQTLRCASPRLRARILGRLQIALVRALPPSALVAKVEIAGAGFINFFLNADAYHEQIRIALEQGDHYGRSQLGAGTRVQVEFVSANPTGPLHVGHGRHAAFGASVGNLLDAVGYQVQREYYINDAGRQMEILAVSTWLRYLELCGESLTFPANGYRGDYIVDIARQLLAVEGSALKRTGARSIPESACGRTCGRRQGRVYRRGHRACPLADW